MNIVEVMVNGACIGTGATLLMDAVAYLKKRMAGIPSLDYRLVGRWLGHMLQGRFKHSAIATASPTRHERLVGWGVHYLTGMVFATLLVASAGGAWLARPTLLPALLAGLISVAAPWLLMQPAWGMGIAAAHTAKPWAARQKSLTTHLTFGLGLYIAAWVMAFYR